MIRLAASRLRARRRAGDRNAQSGVPGHLRHPLLSGPDAHAAQCRIRCWRSTWKSIGLGGIEVHQLSPAVESMPALAALPEDFREAFFGGLDYAIMGRKL